MTPIQRALCAMIIGSVVAAGPVAARLPAQAPPLPPPDPGDYDIVHVDTAQALANACWNLSSNRAIVIAPGVYDLSAVSFPNGVDGRLTVGRFGATPISNIQIRGATDDAADVVIHGAGMLDPQVPYGFHLFTSHDVTIANLSVGEVYYHAIGIDGPQGARNVRLYNIRAFDAGQQIIKGSGVGATDVEVAHNLSDAAILPRNGAVPILTDNETGAQPSWFQNEADADLRLTPGAVAAIAQVSRRNDSPDDFEGLIRHAPRDCPHSARTNMRRSASFSTASSRFPAVARAPAHRTTVRLAAALRRGTIATSHPARTACQARPALQPSAARFSNR